MPLRPHALLAVVMTLGCVLAFCGAFFGTPFNGSAAHAKSLENYRPVNLIDLTHMAISMNALKLDDGAAFQEYMKIVDCNGFMQIKDSQFKMQEMQHAVLAQVNKNQALQQKHDGLYISIPTTFATSGYNFDTQSLDIVPDNHLRRVNVLMLTGVRDMICGTRGTEFTRIPTHYRAQLNMPVSLYRIPIQKNLAETVMGRLDISRTRDTHRIIYGNVLVQIEGIQPEISANPSNYQAIGTLRGQVAAIDLYIDHERKIRFKRLSYLDAF